MQLTRQPRALHVLRRYNYRSEFLNSLTLSRERIEQTVYCIGELGKLPVSNERRQRTRTELSNRYGFCNSFELSDR